MLCKRRESTLFGTALWPDGSGKVRTPYQARLRFWVVPLGWFSLHAWGAAAGHAGYDELQDAARDRGRHAAQATDACETRHGGAVRMIGRARDGNDLDSRSLRRRPENATYRKEILMNAESLDDW